MLLSILYLNLKKKNAKMMPFTVFRFKKAPNIKQNKNAKIHCENAKLRKEYEEYITKNAI